MMPMDYANSHTFKVVLTKEEMCANTHPFKVSLEGGGIEARIVDELPEEGEPGYIYLVLREETEEGNIYDEYMWVLQQDGETYDWEKIGSTDAIPLTLYDEPGTNTDGAMTQNAATRMVHPSGSTSYNIGIGRASAGDGISTIRIGVNSVASMGGIVLGNSATTGTGGSSQFRYAMALGQGSNAGSGTGSVALGAYALTQRNGEVNIGSTNTNYGYNGTNYRVLGGVHDPINNQDAATKKYVDAAVASAGPTVVQTTGQSTTNVMSQKATTDMIFNPDNSAIQIGAIYADNDGVAIGDGSQHNDAVRCVTIGKDSYSSSDNGIAIGYNARTDNGAGIALGENSYANEVDGVLSIGNNDSDHGTVFTRRIINVTDPTESSDAATKHYVDSTLPTDFGTLEYYPFTITHNVSQTSYTSATIDNQTTLNNKLKSLGRLGEIQSTFSYSWNNSTWSYGGQEYTTSELLSDFGISASTTGTQSQGPYPYFRLSLGSTVDTTAQTQTYIIDNERKYKALGTNGNQTSCFVITDDFILPKAAVKSYTFGTDCSYTPNYFLYYCQNLTTVTEPSNILQKIGDSFCMGCTSLNCNFSNGGAITEIGNNFLAGCTSFCGDVFANGNYIQKIGNGFMQNCTSFTNKEFLGTSHSYLEEIGDNFMYGCVLFTGNSPRAGALILTGIKKIGNNFMHGCTAFCPRRLTIGSSGSTAGIIEIGDYFLSGCTSFRGTSNYGEIRAFDVGKVGNYFMQGCTALTQFYSSIVHSSGGIPTKEIGDGFLSGCTALTKLIEMPKLETVGNYFLDNCSSFNQTIDLSSLEKVGSYFMRGCSSFNQNLDLPMLKKIDTNNLMNGCNAMTGTINLGFCPAPTADNTTAFSTTNSSADCYTTGITLYGIFADQWVTILPDRDTSPYRKLINGGGQIAGGGEEILSADWADLWSGVIENVNGVGL